MGPGWSAPRPRIGVTTHKNPTGYHSDLCPTLRTTPPGRTRIPPPPPETARASADQRRRVARSTKSGWGGVHRTFPPCLLVTWTAATPRLLTSKNFLTGAWLTCPQPPPFRAPSATISSSSLLLSYELMCVGCRGTSVSDLGPSGNSSGTEFESDEPATPYDAPYAAPGMRVDMVPPPPLPASYGMPMESFAKVPVRRLADDVRNPCLMPSQLAPPHEYPQDSQFGWTPQQVGCHRPPRRPDHKQMLPAHMPLLGWQSMQPGAFAQGPLPGGGCSIKHEYMPKEWPLGPPPPPNHHPPPLAHGRHRGSIPPARPPPPPHKPGGAPAKASPPPCDAACACPFCQGAGATTGGKTRQRRALTRERKTPKVGRWWRQFGYEGPQYCQRCSEVFRDHIMRQKRNSAECSRESPCDDCFKVLQHFDVNGQDLWSRFDERAKRNRQKRSQNASNSSDGQRAAKKSKSVAAGALGLIGIACVAFFGYGHHPSNGSPGSASTDQELSFQSAAQDCEQWRRVQQTAAPPARVGAATWTNVDGDLMMFGGASAATSAPTGQHVRFRDTSLSFQPSVDVHGHHNDLWAIKRSNGSSQAAAVTFVFEQVAAKSDVWPEPRSYAMPFTDHNGNAFVFGGMNAESTSGMSDLWQFDGSDWTYIAGSSSPSDMAQRPSDASLLARAQAAADHGWPLPRARGTITMSADKKYGFLFGGSLAWHDGAALPLADLWFLGDASYQIGGPNNQDFQADPMEPGTLLGSSLWRSKEQRWFEASWGDSAGWVYQGPANTVYVGSEERRWFDASRVHGLHSQVLPINWPSARANHAAWIDQAGKLLIFGGVGIIGHGDCGILRDIWEWDAKWISDGGNYPTSHPVTPGTPFKWSKSAGSWQVVVENAPAPSLGVPQPRISSLTALKGEAGDGELHAGQSDAPRDLPSLPDDIKDVWLLGQGPLGEQTPAQCVTAWTARLPVSRRVGGMNAYDTQVNHKTAKTYGSQEVVVDTNAVAPSLQAAAGQASQLWLITPDHIDRVSSKTDVNGTSWQVDASRTCRVADEIASLHRRSGFASWPTPDGFIMLGGMQAGSARPQSDMWVFGSRPVEFIAEVPRTRHENWTRSDGHSGRGDTADMRSKRASILVNLTDPSVVSACGRQARIVHLHRNSQLGFGLQLANDNGEVVGYGLTDNSSLVGPAESAGIIAGDALCAVGSPARALVLDTYDSFATSILRYFTGKEDVVLLFRDVPIRQHQSDDGEVVFMCNGTASQRPCNGH